MDLPILILAAGQSARMRGVDKLFEPVDGVALLRRQILMASALDTQVFVALPNAAHPRAACLDGTTATAIIAPNAADGMGVTLKESVAGLIPCAAFMILLADLVGIETADLRTLIRTRDIHPDNLVWRGATSAGKPGHPIIFDQCLRPAFATLSGDTGGAPILKQHKDQTYLVPLPDNRALLDLDTPEDWAQWRAQTGR